jgi:hypothetical protein
LLKGSVVKLAYKFHLREQKTFLPRRGIKPELEGTTKHVHTIDNESDGAIPFLVRHVRVMRETKRVVLQSPLVVARRSAAALRALTFSYHWTRTCLPCRAFRKTNRAPGGGKSW